MPFHLNPLQKPPTPSAPNSSDSGSSDTYLLPTLSHIHFHSFLTAPFYATLFPFSPDTHAGIISSILARHTDSLLNDPTCHFISLLYSAEPETGEPWRVVAFVKYRIFRNEADLEGRTDAGTREWPVGTHLGFAGEMWGKVTGARRRYGKALGPHVDVEILATEPGFHRKGAGRMLMEKVCEEADALGLRCYLEGTEEGRRLYEKCGFVGKEDLWLDLARWEGGGDKGVDWRGENAKEGEGEGWYDFLIMLREAKR